MITPAIDGLGKIALLPGTQAQAKPSPAAPQDQAPKGAPPAPPPGDMVSVSPDAAHEAARRQPAAQPPEVEPVVDHEEMSSRIREAVEGIMSRATSVRFSVTQENGDVVVSVVNRDSGEVVRQIPPEEVIHLREALKELKGGLVDEVL